MKKKKRFVCKECGYTSASWIGKCPECFSWNSFIEEIIESPGVRSQFSIEKELLNINKISLEKEIIIKTKEEEINNFSRRSSAPARSRSWSRTAPTSGGSASSATSRA